MSVLLSGRRLGKEPQNHAEHLRAVLISCKFQSDNLLAPRFVHHRNVNKQPRKISMMLRPLLCCSCDLSCVVRSLLWMAVLFTNTDYTLANNATNVSGCSFDPSCLKCGPPGCVKCSRTIVYPSRRCADSCPYGYRERWSTKTDYMGRMCVQMGNFLGASNETLTVLTGVLCGFILCAILIGSAFVYVKYKRKRALHASAETGSELDDTPERRDFLKQIETIRPYAHTFLDMLNDTRRQMRELYNDGDNTALAAYRPVVRDLAKLLLLLNRPVDRVSIPDDWEHLYNWSEKTLKRYKRMSEVSQPQVAQLINFLQAPILSSEDITDHDSGSRTGTTNTNLSTFKPDNFKGAFGSNLSLQDTAVRNFNMNYEAAFPTTINPQWKFDFPVGNSSEFNPVVWKSSKEFLNNTYFLDDDFCQLGFRPQDEITTEL